MNRHAADNRPSSSPRDDLARTGQTPLAPYDQPICSDGLLAPYGPTEPKQPMRAWSIERLLRFKWTFLVVFLLVAVPAIAAIWHFSVPKYTAKAEVRVRPIIPRLVFTTEDNGMIPLYQSFMNTQVSIMRSPAVLGRTLDQADVQNTAWYKTPDSPFLNIGAVPTPLERFRSDLSVSPRGQTELIDVSMTTLKADEAAAIVNAVLDQYIKYTREQSDATSDQLYRKLTAEQESLRSEIAGSEKVVANLSKDLGTSTPEQLVSQMRLRLDESETKLKTLRQELVTASWQEKQLAALLPHEEADTKLEALQRELATLGWQEKQLTTLPPQQVPPSPNPTESAKGVSNTTPPVASQPPYETDDLWRQLYHDLTIVKGQVQLENQRLKDSHPRRLELRQQVEVAEKMLRDRQQELDARWKAHPQMLVTTGPVALAATGVRTEPDVVKDMDTVRQQIKLLQYQEYLQVEDVKAQRTEFKRVFENAQLQEKENEEIRHKRGLYEAVRMRVDQKEMERNVPGSIEVLTKASAPSEASNDRRLLMSLLAVLGGLGAGAATCFLRLSTTQTIHEPDDLGQTAATPFLGQLPFIQSKAKAPVEESELLLESMRMLRTALLQRIDYQKGSIVQITSAEPGAGKSTVAAMLARSLAQCGKKVLLVDADLRNPTFTRRFGVSQEPGLIGALTGTTDDEAIIGTDTPLLSILPSGRARRGADAELVANGVLSACLQRWQQRYDLVLLDSPPLLPVADARILARKADGTIMVVRERRSQRASVFEAMSYLQIAGGKLLGVVFIGSGGRSGYPQYSYQYGYGKSSDEPGNKQDSKSD